MQRIFVIFVWLFFFSSMALGQKSAPPSAEQLAEITTRGRLLAEYDQAAWHATDAVMEMHPQHNQGSTFACRKTGSSWTCVFGHLEADKLLIDYAAVQGTDPKTFQVKHHEPPAEDTGFYRAAIKAILTATRDFMATAENRPYNPSLLPAPSGQFYVYLVPAQTKNDIFPLGGDARYLITEDGATIVNKRQLHKTILEVKPTGEHGDIKPVNGVHSHVLSDVPEDTDVFFVLTRKPSIPEWIILGKNRPAYVVGTDGKINVLLKWPEQK